MGFAKLIEEVFVRNLFRSDLMTVTLKVDGMMCGGCENRIKNTLKELDYVKTIEASHITKTVTVDITEDKIVDIKAKIAALGFDIIE